MSSGLYSGVSGLALGIGLYRGVSGLWGGASGLDAGFAGGSPYSGASLYLDFLTMTAPTFDSRITFSRGTNATLTDSTGRLTYAPNNVVTNSVGPSANTGTTVATVSGAAPDGTNAVRLSKTDATTPRYSNWTTLFTVQANTAYVASAYFKYDGFNTTVSVEYNNGTHFGTTWVATFNVTASGITANSPSNCTSGVQAVGNGWFRVWAAFTSGTPSAPTNPTFLTQITGGAGTTVLVTWGQLEQVTYQTTPSTYVATTAAAYYGPRFDYDPVTLAARGLLIEEQRTNLLRYSAQFDNAVWTNATPNVPTVTTNTTIAPDGTLTADTLTAATGGVSSQTRQNVSATGATGNFTGSVYLKAGTSTRSRILLVDSTVTFTIVGDFSITWTGAIASIQSVTSGTASITDAGNGWYRCVITANVPSANASVQLSIYPDSLSGTGSVFAWGAQIELGAFATSYIPTVASTVTRNADNATMTGTNFSGWYNQSQGTFVMSLTPRGVPTGAANMRFLEVNDGTGNNRNPLMYATPTGQAFTQYRVATVDQANLGSAAGYFAANTTIAISTAYATNDFASSFSGGTVQTDTSGSVVSGATQMTIGYATSAGAGSEVFCGHILTIAYFNTRQPNSQLQTLTAPSLASTLSLDFINGAYNVGF